MFPDVNCYGYGVIGHYAMYCPRDAGTNAAPTGAAAAATAAATAATAASAAAATTAARGAARQVIFDFLQRHKVGTNVSNELNVSLTQSPRSSLINPNWILLDSESTVCVFCNKDLLTDMIIHLPSGKKLRFAEGPSGLYYYNVNNKSALFQSNFCFLNTVEMSKANFRNHEVKGATLARKLSRLLLHPAETKLQDILTNNRITNNPVMPADAKRATYIWGRAVPDL